MFSLNISSHMFTVANAQEIFEALFKYLKQGFRCNMW